MYGVLDVTETGNIQHLHHEYFLFLKSGIWANRLCFPIVVFRSAGFYSIGDSTKYTSAANNALTGIVSIHATNRLRVIPHLTAERRFVAPTPIIAPVMVCVVLTGIFNISVMGTSTA